MNALIVGDLCAASDDRFSPASMSQKKDWLSTTVNGISNIQLDW